MSPSRTSLIGEQAGLTVAFDHAGIEGVPELDLAMGGAGELDRPVLGFRRERDDHIERFAFEIVEGLGPVAADVDPDLRHDEHRERITPAAAAHARRIDEESGAEEALHQPFRHGRAHGVPRAGEEDTAGERAHGGD